MGTIHFFCVTLQWESLAKIQGKGAGKTMLQPGRSLTFSFWEAGCLILVAARDLGGLDYDEFCHLVWGENPEKLRQWIIERKAFIPLDLYQDDGYRVCVRLGDLTEQEWAEWVARCRWQLDLRCGQMVVTGVVGDEDFQAIANGETLGADSEDLLCYVDVPPGLYQVDIYSFAPGDLSTGWGQIVNPSLFRPTDGIEPEPLADYWLRTRPGEVPPAWIGVELTTDPLEKERLYQTMGDSPYVDFVICLTPAVEDLPTPTIDAGGAVQWEFRKPEKCPLGITTT